MVKYKAVVLTHGSPLLSQVSPSYPQGDTGQGLETFLVVTAGAGVPSAPGG